MFLTFVLLSYSTFYVSLVCFLEKPCILIISNLNPSKMQYFCYFYDIFELFSLSEWSPLHFKRNLKNTQLNLCLSDRQYTMYTWISNLCWSIQWLLPELLELFHVFWLRGMCAKKQHANSKYNSYNTGYACITVYNLSLEFANGVESNIVKICSPRQCNIWT